MTAASSAPMTDGAFGIQLGGHVGTADDVHRLCQQPADRPATRCEGLLSGTDDHLIHRQALLLVAHLDVKPGIVDTQVLDAGEHLHLAILEHGCDGSSRWSCQGRRPPCSPCAGATRSGAQGHRFRGSQAAALYPVACRYPSFEPVIAMAFSIRRSSLFHQVFGHIEADAAGADDRHLLANRLGSRSTSR